MTCTFAFYCHQQQLSLGYHTDSYLYFWKDVDILAIDTINSGSGMVGPINLV